MTRIGWDTDTQRYIFRDTDGSIYDAEPGGQLRLVSRPSRDNNQGSISSHLQSTVNKTDPRRRTSAADARPPSEAQPDHDNIRHLANLPGHASFTHDCYCVVQQDILAE